MLSRILLNITVGLLVTLGDSQPKAIPKIGNEIWRIHIVVKSMHAKYVQSVPMQERAGSWSEIVSPIFGVSGQAMKGVEKIDIS